MNTLGKRIRQLRKSLNMSGDELGAKTGFTRNAVSQWESDKRSPNLTTLSQLAKIFNVSTDYLLNGSDSRALTPRDERDIQARIAEITADLESTEGLAFYNGGEPMSAEDMELLKISLENSVRLAKQLAKAREK